MRVRIPVILALAVAVAMWAAPAAAAPTQDELAPVALTTADIGSEFSVFQSGPAEQLTALNVPNHVAVLARTFGFLGLQFEAVVSVLADAAAADAATGGDTASVLGVLRGFGVSLEPADAPAIGSDTLRYRLSGNVLGQRIRGDCIVWRQSSVLAAVCALGDTDKSAETYAERQQAKIIAAFGE